MAELSAIYVHPIKALDSTGLDSVAVSEIGGLVHDREYAIVDADGDYVNGKRTADVHRLQVEYGPDLDSVEIGVHDGEASTTFDLEDDRAALEAWLSHYFGYEVALRRAPGGRYTDGAVYGEELRPGPSLISRATLREAASWFDGISPGEMRRRLRPNLVVEGVEPFWEDRLLADGGVAFRIGDQRLQGIEPIPRCVVPARDPDTGEELDEFRTTFIRQRQATLPEWVDEDAFDHMFAMMIAAGVPADAAGSLRVGDEVVLEGSDGS